MIRIVFKTAFIPLLLGWAGTARGDDSPAPEARGYLGVMLAPVPDSLRAHLKLEDGVLLQEIVPGGPGDKAGLRLYDVVVSADGQSVKEPEDLKKLVRGAKQGQTLKLTVRRGSESVNVEAVLGAPPAPFTLKAEEENTANQPGFLGVGYGEVPGGLAFHLGLKDGSGVLVGDVLKDSPAEKAGIESKDVIVAIDGREVQGSNDFLQLLLEKKAGQELKVDFIHKGEKKSAQVLLTPRPSDFPRGGRPNIRVPGRPMPLWGPGATRRGKIILRGPEGGEQVFELPGAMWDADEIFKDFEDKLKELKETNLPKLKAELRKGLRELEDKLRDEGGEVHSPASESHVSIQRTRDGDFDITVRDENGIRSITVVKGKETIAENLPFEKVETLPAEVRERVQKAVESFKQSPPHAGKAGRLPGFRIEKEEKLRA